MIADAMVCLSLRSCAPLAVALVVGGCSEPSEVTEGSTGSTTEGTTMASSTGAGSTGGDSAVTASSMGTGGGSSSGGPADSSGTAGSSGDSGTTMGLEDTGREGSTGEPSPIGCADGTREALFDEMAYPDIAACAGGFWVPGVRLNTPFCDRQGGNDGPLSDGMGCSIDDLCAEGWHLCGSRYEVQTAGIGDCGGIAWNGQFFATGQSGEGANACDDTGTNDVFGCGDIGYTNISGCNPLNRSTGNLCVEISGPWDCDEDAYDEVSHIVKTGPSEGGALCCRDGL